jgi:putative transposase
MRRSRFTEDQIVGILREQGTGTKIAEICRKHGISEATFYAWKAKLAARSLSGANRLKLLEEENSRLKMLLAEMMLERDRLKPGGHAARR